MKYRPVLVRKRKVNFSFHSLKRAIAKLVSRIVRDDEAVGSSPTSPTHKTKKS